MIDTETGLASAIYEGTVRHRRYTPKSHEFSYKVFMVYLDLNELDQVFQQSPWWSMNRFNVAQFKRTDFFDGKTGSLYDAVADYVEAYNDTLHNVEPSNKKRPEGPIRVLTNLRYYGYIINPITIYYCFDKAGERVETIVADVTNTPWGERCHYVLHVDNDTQKKQQFRFAKGMHVSPFQPMNLEYHWASATPEKNLSVHIDVRQDQTSVFDATMIMQRQPMTRKAMNTIIWRYPWMTLKVCLGIYWQALRLSFKRIPFYSNLHTNMTNK